jgi:hypothetical protein
MTGNELPTLFFEGIHLPLATPSMTLLGIRNYCEELTNAIGMIWRNTGPPGEVAPSVSCGILQV